VELRKYEIQSLATPAPQSSDTPDTPETPDEPSPYLFFHYLKGVEAKERIANYFPSPPTTGAITSDMRRILVTILIVHSMLLIVDG
jgi:hypothetical protein